MPCNIAIYRNLSMTLHITGGIDAKGNDLLAKPVKFARVVLIWDD